MAEKHHFRFRKTGNATKSAVGLRGTEIATILAFEQELAGQMAVIPAARRIDAGITWRIEGLSIPATNVLWDS